jgi:hypothetical protein
MMRFSIRASCNEVSTACRALMSRRVRPCCCRLGHAVRVIRVAFEDNAFSIRLLVQKRQSTAALQNVPPLNEEEEEGLLPSALPEVPAYKK